MNTEPVQSPAVLTQIICSRRSVRNFSDRELGDDAVQAILADAQRAPSGYNLQPTHFVVVRGDLRAALSRAAFDQRQILEAPVTVALVVDLRSDLRHLDDVIQRDLEAGAIDDRYVGFMRRVVRLTFARGPLGVLGWAKGCLTRLLGRFKPMPEFPAANPAGWATRQAMFVADHMLLSATARGVASCPMEGFGEARARRLLGVPAGYRVALLIPLGYEVDSPEEAPTFRSRLPLDEVVHRGRW